MARDEWYDLYESGDVAEEATLRELDSEPPERVGRPPRTPPGHCPICQAPLRKIDWGCLTCGSVLTLIRCESEGARWAGSSEPRPPEARLQPRGRARLGGRPFTVGFEVEPEGSARVRHVFEVAAEGRSTREIGEELGMQATQVRRVLASTEYRGDKGFPRIIEPELWAKARRRLREARPRRRS